MIHTGCYVAALNFFQGLFEFVIYSNAKILNGRGQNFYTHFVLPDKKSTPKSCILFKDKVRSLHNAICTTRFHFSWCLIAPIAIAKSKNKTFTGTENPPKILQTQSGYKSIIRSSFNTICTTRFHVWSFSTRYLSRIYAQSAQCVST